MFCTSCKSVSSFQKVCTNWNCRKKFYGMQILTCLPSANASSGFFVCVFIGSHSNDPAVIFFFCSSGKLPGNVPGTKTYCVKFSSLSWLLSAEAVGLEVEWGLSCRQPQRPWLVEGIFLCLVSAMPFCPFFWSLLVEAEQRPTLWSFCCVWALTTTPSQSDSESETRLKAHGKQTNIHAVFPRTYQHNHNQHLLIAISDES